jgi:hypothetical protein
LLGQNLNTLLQNNLVLDSIIIQNGDTVKTQIAKSSQAIDKKVDYQCKDSLVMEMKDKKITLYENAKVVYDNLTLTAGIIKIDFDNNLVYAYGIYKDSIYSERPNFNQGNQSFLADSLVYNIKTGKGLVYSVFSKQGDGYLHGKYVKRENDSVILVKTGGFTTCELEHPHYIIRFDKAKVVTDKEIITGPVWLEVEDITMPIGLPLGFFPTRTKRQSGILLPTVGESANRGFYLENIGYYFGFSDYVDLALRGDIYTRGSWAIKAETNYKKRYKYEGNLQANFAHNKFGEKGFSNYEVYNDFFIRWYHKQDPKAHPTNRFSANVQLGSSNYTKFNPSSANDYLSNTFTSSIAYSTQLFNLFNLNINARHTQSNTTHRVDVSLPDLSLSSNTIYPFRPKKLTKPLKWYQNLNLRYQLQAKNNLSRPDSTFFNNLSFKDFNIGFQHNLPISLNINFFKYLQWSNQFNTNWRWYFKSIDKNWNPIDSNMVIDTLYKFRMPLDISYTTSLSTRLYGFYSFGKFPLRVIRHVITPSISYTWRPDFSVKPWNYYNVCHTPNGEEWYSPFEGAIFGYPPRGKSSAISFAIANNIEAKIRQRTDTGEMLKKIVLIENLSLSTSYNFAADSFQLSPLIISARTKLFKNFELRYALGLDPYHYDTTGRRIDKFQFDIDKKLFNTQNQEWNLSGNLILQYPNIKRGKTSTSEHNTKKIYPNFRVTIGLNLRHYSSYIPHTNIDFTKSIVANGNIEFTPNWSVSFMTGYDFDLKDFTYTSINIHRDLHCWEIILNWIPTGFRKSYNFTIRIKSPMLQDVKLTKKTDWRDYY